MPKCYPCGERAGSTGPPAWLTITMSGWTKWQFSNCNNCGDYNGTFVIPHTNGIYTCKYDVIYPSAGCGGQPPYSMWIRNDIIVISQYPVTDLRVETRIDSAVYRTPVIKRQSWNDDVFDCQGLLVGQAFTSYLYSPFGGGNQANSHCGRAPNTSAFGNAAAPPTISLYFSN